MPIEHVDQQLSLLLAFLAEKEKIEAQSQKLLSIFFILQIKFVPLHAIKF